MVLDHFESGTIVSLEIAIYKHNANKRWALQVLKSSVGSQKQKSKKQNKEEKYMRE